MNIESHKDIINLWPSVPNLANDIGEKPGTVYKWHRRNSIPSTKWGVLLDAAKRNRFTLKAENFIHAKKEKAA